MIFDWPRLHEVLPWMRQHRDLTSQELHDALLREFPDHHVTNAVYFGLTSQTVDPGPQSAAHDSGDGNYEYAQRHRRLSPGTRTEPPEPDDGKSPADTTALRDAIGSAGPRSSASSGSRHTDSQPRQPQAQCGHWAGRGHTLL